MIPAGLLDRRVRIEAPGTAQGPDGAPIETWTPVATVWAHLRDASGREYLAAGATQNSALTQIRIRYRPDIEPEMRVLHGAIVYNVEAVLGQDQDRVELTLMCRRED
jgi:SPP1 family predicted phage head-tail adaptor